MTQEEYLEKVIEGVREFSTPPKKSTYELIKDDAWFCGNALLFLGKTEFSSENKEEVDEAGRQKQELVLYYSQRLLEALWDERYLTETEPK